MTARGDRPLLLVRLDREPAGPLPLFARLRRGAVVGGARVLYCQPEEGVLAPTTQVEVMDALKVEVERRGGTVLVRVEPGVFTGDPVDVLVYPAKVWDEVEANYIEPLASGKPPMNPGVLFTGPPGTGKSSLIEVLARGYGLVPLTLDSSVLSSYIGETERKMVELLDNAEQNQPAIIVFDECEWLLEARKHVSLSGYAQALSATVSVLLARMQQWKNKRVRVLIAAATNRAPADLDPAFLRPGRFKPIFVPLPDYEALKIYFTERGLKPQEADALARQAANAGLNMADAAEIVATVRKGRRPSLEPRQTEGYRRLIPPRVEISVTRELDWLPRLVPPSLLSSPWARLEVVGEVAERVALPVFAFYAVEQGRPLLEVWASSLNTLQEAVSTASQSGAVVIVRSDHVPAEAVAYLHNTARCPLFLFGTQARLPGSDRLTDEVFAPLRKFEVILRLLLAYYEVSHTEADIRSCLALTDKGKRALLQSVSLFAKGKLSEALAYVMAVKQP